MQSVDLHEVRSYGSTMHHVKKLSLHSIAPAQNLTTPLQPHLNFCVVVLSNVFTRNSLPQIGALWVCRDCNAQNPMEHNPKQRIPSG